MVFGFKKTAAKVNMNSPEVYAALIKEIEEETANPQFATELIEVEIPKLPCTKCESCVPYCQKCINIPMVLEALELNRQGKTEEAKDFYLASLPGHGTATSCIGCGFCESECPEDIHVTHWVAYAAHIWEQKPFKPIDGSAN